MSTDLKAYKFLPRECFVTKYSQQRSTFSCGIMSIMPNTLYCAVHFRLSKITGPRRTSGGKPLKMVLRRGKYYLSTFGYPAFSSFPTMFQRHSDTNTINLSSANAFNMDKSSILSS